MEFLEVVTIPVSDQDKSKEFYLMIGFELIIEAPMGDGKKWVQLGFPGQTTSITLFADKMEKMPPGSLQGLVVRTKDIAKETADLIAKGVNVSKIDETPWGKFANVYDPDGNSLVLRQE